MCGGVRVVSGRGRTSLLWVTWGMLLLTLGSLWAAQPARAQDERITVRVDGRALFRVGPTADANAATRAQQIENRINTLLQNPQAIAPAQIQRSTTNPDERIITVAGVRVVTVTPVDAEDNVIAVDALATQWATLLDQALARARSERTSVWSRFTNDVRASVTTAFARLTESAITVVPGVLAAVLVLGLFWLLATTLRATMRVVFHHIVDDRTTENLIKQLTYYSVWLLGVVIAAGALGFDPTTVVAGLGLTGVALGFALRDILSNFFSGILILLTRPFEIGDQIVIGDIEGNVERIVLRATEIRTYDGRQVLVPNSEVFTSRVTNNTASPVRRASVTLFVGYDSDLEHAIAVVQSAVATVEGVLASPPPAVRVSELGQDDLALDVSFWTDSRRSDFVATSSAVRRTLVSALRHAGIGLPDPDVRILVPRHPRQWHEALGGTARDGADGDNQPVSRNPA